MHKKCWLIQPFLDSVNNKFFHRDLPVFPLILTEILAECSMIQPWNLSFTYFFLFGAEIYELEIFKSLPFFKINAREISKTCHSSK